VKCDRLRLMCAKRPWLRISHYVRNDVWESSHFEWSLRDKESQKKYDGAFNGTQFNGAFEYQTNTKAKKDPLPQSLKKRKKIVKEFSEKNDLFLTEEQINSIANASYMSNYWKAEIMDMQQKYEVIYEWFRGYTDWLRAYMYVFRVQEITSDFTQQQKIVAYAFNEVFNYSDTLKGMPLSMRIKRVNDKFFTNFDDITFMIAYRFLEERGIKHDLSEGEIVNADKEMDDLLEKYKVNGQGMV